MNDNEKKPLLNDAPKQTDEKRPWYSVFKDAQFKARAKKAGKISGFVAKSTLWYPLKVAFYIITKVCSWIIEIFLTAMLVGIITGVVVCCAFIMYIQNYIDPNYEGLANLKFDSDLNTTMYYVDSNGDEVLLPEDTLHGSENRLWVDFKDIPDDLIDAVISIEDQRFYQHKGVDIKRTVGAVLNFFMPSGGSYGGSTLTQQLIKNVSGENETTIQRKVQEIFRALNVETKYSKTEILEMYMNVIYLSQNSNGVQAAANAYFGKDVSELTLVECAAIAAIPKFPTYYDPLRNPDNNLKRRNLILKEMLSQGVISQEEFDGAYNVPLYLNQTSGTEDEAQEGENIHSYYIDAVIDDVIYAFMEKYGIDKSTASRRVFSGGLTIVTNLDPDIQAIMEEVFEDDNSFPEASGIKPQAAMVVSDKHGNIKGIIGGRGEKTTARGLNRATISKRQCGSAIKPLSIYALALEKGLISYGTPMNDTPTVFDEDEKTYWPGNTPASLGYSGITTLTYAVQKSLNTIPVRLAETIGVDQCFDFLTEKLGFTTLIESKSYGGNVKTDIAISPMALGSFTEGVTVREITQAYTMFTNNGAVAKGRTFSMVKDSNGAILIDNRYPEEVQAISEENAFIMTQLLKSVVNDSLGTAQYMFAGYRKFDKDVEVAGKTGSTNDDRDRYFVGYTPDYTAAVWFGYDSNKSLSKMSYNPATRLWIEVMNRVYNNYLAEQNIPYQKSFIQPYDVVEVEYCSLSGGIATDACRKDIENYLNPKAKSKVVKGYFTRETVPTYECDCHVMVKWDTVTKAICLDGCSCPENQLVEVAFRKIDPRYFEINLLVADSQYTYIDPSLLGEDYLMPSSTRVPFFWNMYDEDHYPGQTYNAKEPYNRVCYDHYTPPEQNDNSDVSSEESNG